MKISLFKKIITVAVLSLSGIVNASLIGDTIDVELTGGLSLLDQAVLVGDNVELQGGDASTNFGAFLFASEFIDIGANTITMAFDTSLGDGGVLSFTDLDFGAGIGNVFFSSSIPEIVLGGFTENSITLDLSAWFAVGGPAEVTMFLVEATPVPVPGALLLMLSALGVFGVRKARV